jgi:hypothetical protein
MMGENSVLLLGCDRIGRTTFSNKIGTFPLVLGARYHEGTTILISEEDKLTDLRIRWLPPPREASAELWKDPPHGVDIDNRYFEEVPVSFVEYGFVGRQRFIGPLETVDLSFPTYHDRTVEVINRVLSGDELDITEQIDGIL